MPLFLFIFCILRYTYIHLITFIQYNYPSPFAEVSLHIFIAGQLSGKTSLWCRAENRTRACLTASRRSINWATPHPLIFPFIPFFPWGQNGMSSVLADQKRPRIWNVKHLVPKCHSFFLWFGGTMPLFLFIFCILRYTYIHLITFIQYNYPSPFAEVSLHIFIAGQLSGKTSLWCRAENRTRACLTASRRSINWATPHPLIFPFIPFFPWGQNGMSSVLADQ